MNDKTRGTFAMVVGAVAQVHAYFLYRRGIRDWHMKLEIVAGLILIVLGIWRFRRQPDEV